MKIVIAPDSYKESLNAFAVATAIEQGFREIWPDADYVKLPVADGGEGTVEAMVEATSGHIVHVDVTGPLGQQVSAFYGLSGDERTAFIEMAAASGLELVPVNKRNPLITTSWGTGELIRHALDAGVEHIIIGIGGSATNDGGAGMVQALGAKLLDAQGQQIAQGGAALELLAKIDISQLDPRLASCRIEVACDVTNPLTGEEGASVIFGPQKGATPKMIARLDNALSHYAQIIASDLGLEVSELAGGGAAGGMGVALYAFCGAQLRRGIEIVTDALNLDECVADADLVITGEGRIDSQTIHGKVPVGVAKIAKRYHKPVIGIAGSLTADVGVVHQHGLDAVFSVIYSVCSLDDALENAAENVRLTARNIAATIKIGQTVNSAPY
ncbi:glycerate kinase [Escherichia fergusonii]|uniref:Glycerate kinase n=1 Tax=Escherichia fergusonii (strain ATCC 35469 / DSM 13698 / CCUG 18766 / IAM 14443 / JCM 21226 / LMG 7866 / NBRC 102419 / NCTC 12128 / CDC 0568-73) TaxID=585054 RepID=B7LVV5_ESCF3|nr:glycerate kinase [Escherichia fergusonii]EGC94032.1 Glycerate kinase [Escherichia fergusonii ECD227]EIH2138354.1 glycerate kinase [Escherichia fergusonii]EIH2157899.1 glycerate kinase [Escherichia fergusonii]EIH9412132.1 glycerate kinase [Escherichia fergusonii]EIH9432706.1 glycerate kinase [Escherichia fergusonii]